MSLTGYFRQISGLFAQTARQNAERVIRVPDPQVQTLAPSRIDPLSAPKPPPPRPAASAPITVARLEARAQERPAGGGVECFETPGARAINQARLAHLASLNLPLSGRRVIDLGCGVGHLAQFFVQRGCQVVCVDGRAENIHHLRKIYPGLEGHVGHVEVDPLSQYGEFDVVLSYGLLYHLENPVAGLRNMASVCKDLLLLETCVCDCTLPYVAAIDEPPSFNQTMDAMGCRPSPAFVAMALNRVGFPFVYTAVTPPDHHDFLFEQKDNLDHCRDGHLLRCIFVASRTELFNPALRSMLTK